MIKDLQFRIDEKAEKAAKNKINTILMNICKEFESCIYDLKRKGRKDCYICTNNDGIYDLFNQEAIDIIEDIERKEIKKQIEESLLS